MPVLKLYKDKNIDCEKDLVLIEDYLIKIMKMMIGQKILRFQMELAKLVSVYLVIVTGEVNNFRNKI